MTYPFISYLTLIFLIKHIPYGVNLRLRDNPWYNTLGDRIYWRPAENYAVEGTSLYTHLYCGGTQRSLILLIPTIYPFGKKKMQDWPQKIGNYGAPSCVTHTMHAYWCHAYPWSYLYCIICAKWSSGVHAWI